MDRIGLQTLSDELLADAAEAEQAMAHARERMQIRGPRIRKGVLFIAPAVAGARFAAGCQRAAGS
jgi:hypothetical protein